MHIECRITGDFVIRESDGRMTGVAYFSDSSPSTNPKFIFKVCTAKGISCGRPQEFRW